MSEQTTACEHHQARWEAPPIGTFDFPWICRDCGERVNPSPDAILETPFTWTTLLEERVALQAQLAAERERSERLRNVLDDAEASFHHAGCEQCLVNQEHLRAALKAYIEASDDTHA